MFKWLLDVVDGQPLAGLSPAWYWLLTALSRFLLHRWMFSDLNRPTVTIMTESGGMAAEEVEQLISSLETTMNGLPRVEASAPAPAPACPSST